MSRSNARRNAVLSSGYSSCRWISEAVVFGDRRPYLVALITLDPDETAALAEHVGVAADDALAALPAVRAEIDAAVRAANERLAPIEQVKRDMNAELRQAIVDGAYWLRHPGPNCQVVVAYTGTVAPEAIQAVGLIAEDRRDVGLLAVTSADRLNAGWSAAQRARERGLVHARSHIERLLAEVPGHCGIVTVVDGHPATLAWLGAVGGHRVRPLGVEHFGQTGSIPDLYRHYGIDANAIVAAAQTIVPGRPIRHLRALD